MTIGEVIEMLKKIFEYIKTLFEEFFVTEEEGEAGTDTETPEA